jgi:hypothetical protein
MIEQARCYTSTFLPDGKILITAFFFSNGVVNATPELYDPSTGTFTATGRFVNTPADQLFDYTATLLPNGKVLIAEPIAQLYDPVSGTFSLTGPMIAPVERFGRTATVLTNGKVLLAGGEDDFGRSRTAELYDPSSGTFTVTGSMTKGRAWHSATLLPNGTVLIAGGETEDCDNRGCFFAGSTASAEIYDPSTGTFSPVANMNARRELHTATLLNNGRVLVAGGLWYAGIGDFRGRLASVELYPALSINPNPIDDSQFFVRQHYLDFLSREPESSGLSAWFGVLNSCPDLHNDPTCDRITVSAAFFGSQEFQLKGVFAFHFYKLAFDRLPRYDEIGRDMQGLSGDTPAEVYSHKAAFANSFTQLPEFQTLYGPLANADFVGALMNRYQLDSITTPDPLHPDDDTKVTLTRVDLIARLDSNIMTRAQVLRAIADSEQVFTFEYNPAFVAMQYYGYLRRTPEERGYQAWLAYLNAHPTDFRTMVRGFVDSIEYRSRFGQP